MPYDKFGKKINRPKKRIKPMGKMSEIGEKVEMGGMPGKKMPIKPKKQRKSGYMKKNKKGMGMKYDW